MEKVVGVTFKNNGKVYYFSPCKDEIKKGSKVIVKTEKGVQFANVETNIFEISKNKLSAPLSPILRVANKNDIKQYEKNNKDSIEAYKKCKELVEKYKMNMIVMSASYTFDRKQLIFTFIADNRVDFRKLAKNLANIYKTRIELRQVGVRDKAKEVGGCGQCGRPLCCSKFLCDFDSVSINMAKDQNIALNPSKINGLCGRLLCCLKYEADTYKEYQKYLPKIGKKIKTEQGEGKVISVDVLKGKYKVDLKEQGIIELEVNYDESIK